jgi:hypothetical protein
MASFSFNAADVAPDTSRELIPAGTYVARISESSYEAMKSGNGHAVKLTLDIIDGPFKNRKLWTQLNVKHINEVAQKIGQQQLSAICHAVGVMNMQDTQQLHNKPLKVRVKIRKDDQYGDKNEVSGYEAIGQASAGSAMPSAPAAQAPAAAVFGGGSKPWQKAA